MKHTPQNLRAYAMDNALRFRCLARQMQQMETPDFKRHFGPEVTETHATVAAYMLKLAALLESHYQQ